MVSREVYFKIRRVNIIHKAYKNLRKFPSGNFYVLTEEGKIICCKVGREVAKQMGKERDGKLMWGQRQRDCLVPPRRSCSPEAQQSLET